MLDTPGSTSSLPQRFFTTPAFLSESLLAQLALAFQLHGRGEGVAGGEDECTTIVSQV